MRVANEVLADLLKRIGINLEYISTDWSSMTQRVINKGPPETVGFHIHMLNVPDLSVASPLVNSRLRGTASEESGWYSSAKYEELRAAWMLADAPAERRRLAEALQVECVESVPLAPAGITLQPAVPIAPPCTVGSEQNAATGAPPTRPTAASMPESSSAVTASALPKPTRAVRPRSPNPASPS